MEILSINDFDRIYEIMEKSFPFNEVRPKEGQRALFNNENYRIFGTRDADLITSVAAVWELDDFIFLEHLATDPKYRNQGRGKLLLEEIIKSTHKTLCLEVEPPIDELTVRRVDFYKRCGMCFNSYHYMQPSLGKGLDAIKLFIMTSQNEVDENEFKKIRNALYTRVYKVEQPD